MVIEQTRNARIPHEIRTSFGTDFVRQLDTEYVCTNEYQTTPPPHTQFILFTIFCACVLATDQHFSVIRLSLLTK